MTSKFILSFLLLNILTVFTSDAQVTRAFEDRASFNVNGNITMAGNTLMTCEYHWWTDFSCNDVKDGTKSGSNNRNMYFVNVDSAAGYANSSSAALTIPNGATVLHAELYWSGRDASTTINRDKIRIKAPGTSSYVRVTAHTVDTYSTEGDAESRPYQASADVTQIVSAGGSGSYSIADLTAKTGRDALGFYGGWAIMVAYQDNSQPFRRLMIFDGAAKVTGTNTVTITTDSLVTPYSGNFDTYLGALVWEGDQSLDGDAFIFEGNTLSDTLNPADNYWNSSITSFNSRVTTKNPDYVNQLSMDLVMTDVSGLLSNGKTQANIDFVTNGDSYFPHALAFVTDLYLPDFGSSMDKVAIDLNGGQVEPGDVIEYRIGFSNTGQDIAINTTVIDTLPAGLTYIPNSIEIVSSDSGPVGTLTDNSSDDAAEFDANNNRITVWMGANATAGQGGSYIPGESGLVKFHALVGNNAPNAEITNTAYMTFNAQTTPNQTLYASNDAVIEVYATAGLNVVKTANLSVDNGNAGTADTNDVITYSITVENTGNLPLSNIGVIDNMAPIDFTCPATTLAAYASMSCDTYTYTVTENDMNEGGHIVNQVNVTADDSGSTAHADSASTQTAITLLPPVITSPQEGDLLNNNVVTVTGTAQPGSLVDVSTSQGGSCQATVDVQGNWSCEIVPTLNEGAVIISAFANNGGTNQSTNTSINIIIDTTAPGAPGITTPTNGQPITGTGEPGATVTVETESGAICTAVVQLDGTWSCTLTGNLVDGDDITATQTDPAGNESDPTIVSGGLDTQAPSVTITAPVNGDLSNDNTPTVSGTSEAGAAISVTIGGAEVCSTVADNNGDWSCDVSPAVNDGVVQIDVTATDAAGNTSNPESISIEIDTAAPAAPGISTPTNGQPITGTGEPGATVTVETESGAICTAVVQLDGTWSCTLTGNLVDGDDITATQTDPAGNESDPTAVPGGLDTQAPSVTITAPANGDLSNDNTPTVSGTSEAGAAISVTIGGVEVCSAIADSNGDWACDVSPAVNDGSVQIDVTATDAAGNTSNPESVTITIDTTAPDAPLINSPSNGQPVTGSGGEPGATVNVTTPSGAYCSATVQADGSWSCNLTGNLVDGDDITATQTDPAGNESGPSTATGGLDTQAPSVTITTPANSDLSNDNTTTVSGTSEAGAAISVTIGGVEVCSAVADNNGDWACDVTPAVNDGTVQIDVTATDAAGNTSNPESVTITVDTTAPDAPLINSPSNGQPITGTGEPGASVTVETESGATCTAVVQLDGFWSCTLTGNLADGDDITATQTDPAGNESDPTVVPGGLDTQAPSVAITAPVNGDLSNDNTPTVSGTSEAGATISVTIGGVEVCSAVADNNGDWACDVTPAVNDGSVQMDVTATDAAGNTSNPESVTITVDTTAPAAPGISTPTNGQPITGTGEPGASVTVETESGAICTAVVQLDGTWSCILTGNLVDGDDITAIQTDPAGNESDPTIVPGGLDTAAPDAPIIQTPTNGVSINDNKPVISGTAEANSTVTVSNQNGVICVAQTNAQGQWSCTPATALADGSHTISAVASDAAGNESQPASIGITINSTVSYTLAVDAPVELVTAEDGSTDTFTIQLPLTPTADVSVTISSSDTTEGTVSPTSVTFTTANWNQPVTITVTGVDDAVYDLDQPYTINFSALISQDSNYDGLQTASIDAINIDDDENADLSVFLTNCIDGSLPQQPISYYLTVKNVGNKDIQNAQVTTNLPLVMTQATWLCEQSGNIPCNLSAGAGNLNELVDLAVGEEMIFTISGEVDGLLYDFLDVTAEITMPVDETDKNPQNNTAMDSDLMYHFIYKHGFECAAPGTIESTNQQLERLLNLN